MLVKFTFRNYKSFLDEQSFSLEARHDREFTENTVPVSGELLPGNEGILKSAVIFGTNASGKSNMLKAADYMKRCVLLSGSSVGIIQRNDPFAFLEGASSLDSHFEMEFIENGTYYRYGFIIREKQVVREWLFKRTERLTPLFKRAEDGLAVTGLSRNEARLLSPSPSVLFISIAENLNLEITPAIRDVLSFYRKLNVVMEPRREDLEIYQQEEKYIKGALDILAKAGTGISDLKIIKDGSYIDAETSHPVYDRDGHMTTMRCVRIFQDGGLLSTGTVKLICTLGLILRALDKGEVLFINDFGAFIHVQVARYILSLFNTGAEAQLITTSHVSLLMDRGMRRDQIWFTSRDGFARSTLLPLYSFKNVRKNDAYSKRYLSGEYTQQLPMII